MTGTALLEQCTTRNRGRRIAIFSQFGEKMKDYRWLAAPVISRRITDGVLVFTPDATREEAEEIAAGLNNVAKKTHTWIGQVICGARSDGGCRPGADLSASHCQPRPL